MSTWSELLKDVIGKAGGVGISEIDEALENLEKESDEPWKSAVLDMLGDAVAKYGWEGVKMVQEAVDDIVDGKKPELGFASLRVRSEVLAALQNEEAKAKSKMNDFFILIGKSLGIILKALIQGLLKG